MVLCTWETTQVCGFATGRMFIVCGLTLPQGVRIHKLYKSLTSVRKHQHPASSRGLEVTLSLWSIFQMESHWSNPLVVGPQRPK